MAVVYEGVAPSGSRAAVKWLTRVTPQRATRFAEEGRFLERLRHPNVAGFLERGMQEGRPWLALDLVAGPDLRLYADKLRQRPPAEREARTRDIARDLCRALAYIHAEGVVHRDVKPANVLLDADGRAVLTDFGVAFSTDEEGRAVGLVGTAAYGAPEQLSGGTVDARADQYGLGGTLYLLLTGRRPFEDGDTAALVLAQIERAPRPPSQVDPTVPADLDAFVLRLLAKDPAARFADMVQAEAAIGAPHAASLPLAGRQPQIDAIAGAVDRVARGSGAIVELRGVRGSGRHWLLALARDAAARRGIACVATDDAAAVAQARAAIAAGAPILLVAPAVVGTERHPGQGASLLPEVLTLTPLGLADVRRSLYALAPGTQDLARVAERLHRESGGNAGLLLLCADACRPDPGANTLVLPAGDLRVDVTPWFDAMDLDEETVACALAALESPALPALLQRLAQVPVDEALAALAARGIACAIELTWRLAAEAFRAPLLDRAPDREGLLLRAAATREPAPDTPDPVLAEVARLRAAGRPADAVPPLEAALAVPQDEGTRASRLMALGALRWTVADPARARAAYEEALPALHSPTLRSRAAIGAGASALQLGDLAGALDHLLIARTEAEVAGDVPRQVLALVNLAEARGYAGELGEALRLARRALMLAEGLRDRGLEAMATRHLGQLLLDAGQVTEASRRLADASALARAADLPDERLAAHVLRARASLVEARGAAAALDRLQPLLAHKGADPEGFLPRARAAWARAAAGLRDGRMRARAEAEASAALVDPRVHVRVGVLVDLALAALTAGETERASDRATQAHDLARAHGFHLLAWQAARVQARAHGDPLPGAGALAHGLTEADAEQLERASR